MSGPSVKARGDAAPDAAPAAIGETKPAVPVRHTGRRLAAVAVLLVGAALAGSVATNPRFGWPTVAQYLFDRQVLNGVLVTLQLTVIAMVIGVALGIVLAIMRRSANPVFSRAAATYIWFFRGTPVLVQLLFWSFLAAVYPTVSIGVPFGGPTFVEADANALITPFIAAILGLALNEAAYMAEIVRAGINSVDRGQTEAAQALGLRPLRVLRKIVLPQAMRMIIPPTGNETINMLKTTSLVSIIALSDLLYSAQLIYSANFQQVPLLIVVSLWYLAATSVLSVAQGFLERHFSRGHAGTGPPRRTRGAAGKWGAFGADRSVTG